jgi:hypothetical protein
MREHPGSKPANSRPKTSTRAENQKGKNQAKRGTNDNQYHRNIVSCHEGDLWHNYSNGFDKTVLKMALRGNGDH